MWSGSVLISNVLLISTPCPLKFIAVWRSLLSHNLKNDWNRKLITGSSDSIDKIWFNLRSKIECQHFDWCRKLSQHKAPDLKSIFYSWRQDQRSSRRCFCSKSRTLSNKPLMMRWTWPLAVVIRRTKRFWNLLTMSDIKTCLSYLKSQSATVEAFLVDDFCGSCDDVVVMTIFSKKFSFVSDFVDFDQTFSDLKQTLEHFTADNDFPVNTILWVCIF